MAIPSLATNVAVDTSDRNTVGYGSRGVSTETGHTFSAPGKAGADGVKQPLTSDRLLRLAQEAESQSSMFMQTGVRTNWARSYRAFRNQHAENSKYRSSEYAGRSKFYRPKTRMAVKRKMAAAAQALFSTGDVISVAAQNEVDDYQKASAELKQAVINYRLSRTSRRNGIRWFLIASGAIQTMQIAGLCISKQTWKYQEEKRPSDGNVVYLKPPKVLVDRPDIDLLPPENVLFDPNCNWLDPVSSSQYIIVRYPQSADDAMTMIEQNISAGNTSFVKGITREGLASSAQAGGPIDTTATRTAREGGKDPTVQTSGYFGRIWLNEVFMRVDGEDVVFWTANNNMLLSHPIPVRQAYPAFGGDRPLVIGYGEIEAFRPYPMAPVESWQGLQMEINDQANLRLDHMKQVIAPPAKVVRGKKVDLKQVQNRGPNGIVMVDKLEDVEWWEQPDVPPSAYQENNVVSSDFDSLAGVFDSGSVANNRQMNETVGGMRLLASATNPMADFDLNVAIETYFEPVLCQLMKLEEYYESDATILAICGQKAKLFERFGIDAITDELLMQESTLTIKLGVGSANLPEERIRRFNEASATVFNFLKPFVEAGVIAPPVPRVKEIIDTIFGAAGYQDGGERFFGVLDDSGQAQPPKPPQQDPAKDAATQAKMAQVQATREKTQIDAQVKIADLQNRKQLAIAQIESEHLKALAEIRRAEIQAGHEATMQGRDHAHAAHGAALDRQHSMLQSQIDSASRAAQAFAKTPNMPGAPGGAPQQPQPQGVAA